MIFLTPRDRMYCKRRLSKHFTDTPRPSHLRSGDQIFVLICQHLQIACHAHAAAAACHRLWQSVADTSSCCCPPSIVAIGCTHMQMLLLAIDYGNRLHSTSALIKKEITIPEIIGGRILYIYVGALLRRLWSVGLLRTTATCWRLVSGLSYQSKQWNGPAIIFLGLFVFLSQIKLWITFPMSNLNILPWSLHYLDVPRDDGRVIELWDYNYHDYYYCYWCCEVFSGAPRAP